MVPIRFARILLLATFSYGLLTVPLHAEPTQADKAAAEALFDQARQLIEQRNFVEACRKLEDSQRLDPAIGTLLNLGLCYEKCDRSASAWGTYREAAAAARSAGQLDREKKARNLANALESKLVRLVVQVNAPTVKGLEVRIDNKPLPSSLWGTPIPVDPNEHVIQAAAPGCQPWSTTVTLRSGKAQKPGDQTSTVQVPSLTPSPAATDRESNTSGGAIAPNPTDNESADQVSARRATEQRALWTPMRTAAVVSGGVGVLGLVLGGYFGIRAKSQWEDAKEACPNLSSCPNGDGPSAQQKASTSATASTVAFLIGGVAAASGITLWVLSSAPSQNAQHARLATYPSTSGTLIYFEGTWQ